MATTFAPDDRIADRHDGDRQTGSGLVTAGDRSAEFRKARRGTSLVRVLRVIFPISAILILGDYGLAILKRAGWGAGLPAIAITRILPEDLAMNNPRYEGFGKDGSSYNFTAKTAQQDLSNTSLIKLNAISGNVFQPDKTKTDITATRGVFDHTASVLELFDSIDVVSESGLKAKLTRATIITKENLITSPEPVLVEFPSGNIRAKTMRLRQKAREATFADTVQVALTPPPPAQNTDAPKTPNNSLFAPGNGPVNINSNRLDVNDLSQVAVFSGNVKASQADSTLTTPEMEVTYEGGGMMSMSATKKPDTPAPTDPAAAAANPANKIRRIVAKQPVVMTRGENETVTSDNADFDAPNETAILSGNVIMASGTDRHAQSDRVDLDQRADTILLTGNVAVTQGENQLNGRRLFIERKTGKAQLTSPPSLGSGPGRINARLSRGEVKAGKLKAVAKASPDDSFATFKTDPTAPVDVEADQLDVNDVAKVAVFRGDVRAAQGTFIINSAELQAFYKGDAALADVTRAEPAKPGEAKPKSQTELTRIEAKRNVIITSAEGRTATGDWAEFNAKTNKVTMGGDVVLSQGQNMVRGTRLLIDMTTGESKIDTAPVNTVAQPAGGGWTTEAPQADKGPTISESGGRASAVFFPQQLKAAGTKDGTKGTTKGQAAGNADSKASTIDGWSASSAPSPQGAAKN